MNPFRTGFFFLLVLGGCDLSVTNPGPVQDASLNNSGAHEALVNGARYHLAIGLNWVAYTGAVVAREVTASGNVGNNFGATPNQRVGILHPDDVNDHWANAQQARWVAEDATRRLRGGLGADFSNARLAAESLLLVGFANRLLGENMCHSVIDGGSPGDANVYLERADAAFVEADEIASRLSATDLVRAAHAGRASVLVSLGDWDGATAEARQVPVDFVFEARYAALARDDYNRFYWANANQPFRAHSVWNTYYEQYYHDSGDPRTPWAAHPEIPFGTVGEVPWYRQMKYGSREAPIRLASGREMELIRAESQLRSGNWGEALEAINRLRTAIGVEGWKGGTLEEVWTALKRERGIELWLEGRRLGDLHRWIRDSSPGQMEDMSDRSTCFPISRSERDTNPNVP